MQAIEPSHSPPWWRRKPTSPLGIALFLIGMTIASGLFSVLINHLLGSSAAWGHFGGGAVMGLVINSITLSLQHHQAGSSHAPVTAPTADAP